MKNYVNDDYFETIQSEDRAYFLGFFVADGSLAKGQHTEEYIRVSLHLQIDDIEILEKFKYYIESDHKIFVGHKFNDCALRFVSRKMVHDIMKYGITPRKTGNENVNLSLIPLNLQRHFFRGLVDGDGWITNSISPTTGRPITSIGICGSQYVCRLFTEYIHNALGYNILNPSKVKDKNCYKLQYSSYTEVAMIANLLYQNSSIYLTRKRDRAFQF